MELSALPVGLRRGCAGRSWVVCPFDSLFPDASCIGRTVSAVRVCFVRGVSGLHSWLGQLLTPADLWRRCWPWTYLLEGSCSSSFTMNVSALLTAEPTCTCGTHLRVGQLVHSDLSGYKEWRMLQDLKIRCIYGLLLQLVAVCCRQLSDVIAPVRTVPC